ncbi:hypothetical protein BDV95DRAFT_606194 [Massariosphaeria phaeospora]|uniref:Dystroglycan-type cadherin-like domain-containing protein n=1 Tax=Massariosphaeria phaeospora TaxID=100035 RepID=A0A7C8MGB4_9PLEO|nr:hypothetical protein BDV95DRAFT_606194 [Massariosphaeria phaeospora]
MAAMGALLRWPTALSLFIAVAAASPNVNYPLKLQFPPVARVGEAYSFQFASTTFQPDPDRLQYSLVGNPSWLSLQGANRTLGGTPGNNDVGNITFTISAAGEAGAVANMESTLLVEKGDGPTLNGDTSQALSKAGQLLGPSSVSLLPSKPFEIEFSLDTFETKGKKLTYHATLADHTPLPAWISFDASTLRFAGTTPASETPQSFEVLLIASNAQDYAACSASFSLIVSNHQLLFNPLQQTLNISKGGAVNISDIRSKLFLDSKPIKDEDIQTTAADLPSWLSFDDETLRITGNPPSRLTSEDLNVTVTDWFGDIATHSIHLFFKSDLFAGEIGPLHVALGERIEHNVPKSILAKDNENVSVDFGSLREWLVFDPATFAISGTIPQSFTPMDVQGSMTATSPDGSARDTQPFQIHVSGAKTASTGTDSGTPNESVGASNAPVGSMKTRKGAVIAGAALGAIFSAAILLALIVYLCRRKKKEKGYISPKGARSPRKADISRPIIRDQSEDLDRNYDADLEKGKAEDIVEKRTPTSVPQLDVDLTAETRDRRSVAILINEHESNMITATDRSSYGLQNETTPSHRPHDSMRIAIEMARKRSDRSPSSLKHRRRTATMYRDPSRSSGLLPLNRRLTGLGHDRHTTQSPSRSRNSLSSICHRISSSSRATSILSTAPSAFPHPPARCTTPMDKHRSVRCVTASTYGSQLDTRPIDEKRSSYIRHRASAPSPFFAAGSSRVSSSSYRSPQGIMSEFTPASNSALSPLTKILVRPDEKVEEVEENGSEPELPDISRTRRPSDTPTVEEQPRYTESLQPPYTGSLRTRRRDKTASQTYPRAVPAIPDRVQEPDEYPTTMTYSRTTIGRRSSNRDVSRARGVKSSLNSLTRKTIFDDAELSESVYSTEEEDIEDYEKRTTVTPNQFTPPPLSLKPVRKSKAESSRDRKQVEKQDTKRYSKRELKPINTRDPTPYSLAREHGGKENHSSTYSLGKPTTSTAAGSQVQAKVNPTQSTGRPKTAIATLRPSRPAHHSRTESRTTNRSSTYRTSNPRSRTSSRQPLDDDRHSRKSQHLRSQSRHSSTIKHVPRDPSTSQSSAYPILHVSSLSDSSRLKTASKPPDTRQNRITTLPIPPRPGTPPNPHSTGLGLGIMHSAGPGRDTACPNCQHGHERTPLSVLSDENGGSPERLRIVQGKERRPVSVEVDPPLMSGANGRDGKGADGSAKGTRRTWGSLKAVLSRGPSSVSRNTESKMFL